MKKLLLMIRRKTILLIALLIVGCEEILQEEDCAGVAGGTAVLDDCDICTGIDSYIAGSCYDCANTPNGDAVFDGCGVCDADTSNDCIQDCLGVWGGDGSTCCEDGETNNDNPCNPWECSNGQWIEMIIDCAEPMGVLCEGGAYIPPEEGECCSECVLFGESEDCNPELICGQALTCCDGLLYPTTCCDSNCDESIEGQNCP